MALCGLSCLRNYTITVAVFLLLASVAGIGFSLFMIFGDPFARDTYGTYRANWENIAPAAVGSIISLLANVSLVGGARQSSRRIVLFWIVWHFLLAAIYWAWYAYSMLKYYGYIDSSELGLRRCYWCDRPEAESLGFGGAVGTLVLSILIMPVIAFHMKLKRESRELTDYELSPVMYDSRHLAYDNQQLAYDNRHYNYKY